MSLEQMEAVCREHRKRMVGYAWKLLGNRADAEDVVQEAFLRWMERGAIDCPTAWVYAVLRSRLMDVRRTYEKRRRHESETSLDELAEVVEAPDEHRLTEVRMEVTAALAVLPEQHRVVLVLHAQGVEDREIATVLSLENEARVRKLRWEARQKAQGLSMRGRPKRMVAG